MSSTLLIHSSCSPSFMPSIVQSRGRYIQLNTTKGGFKISICRDSLITQVCENCSIQAEDQTKLLREHTNASETDSTPGRRGVLLHSTMAALALMITNPGVASCEDQVGSTESVYEDTLSKFSFVIPNDWDKGEGRAGTRRVIAFYPAGESLNTNVSLVITPLGADFTSMGSFGGAESFGERLVNGLDRSWKRPPGQAAKLIQAKGNKDMYFIEYTIQKVGEPKRHFLSAVGIYDNGIYNRLFTLTGQYLETDSDTVGKFVKKAITTFKLGA